MIIQPPPPSIQEIRRFTDYQPLNLNDEFLRLFFSPIYSQRAIDDLENVYHQIVQETTSLSSRFSMMSSGEIKRFVHLAFWDFCRRRAPWGLHPAHLAAFAALVWRHDHITHNMIYWYRDLYVRQDGGSVSEIAASIWPYRQSPIVMTASEMRVLDDLPNMVTVYRGGYADEETISAGCSWSLSKRVAEMFSTLWVSTPWNRHVSDESKNLKARKVVLIEKTIPKGDIITLLLNRYESEVVLCPQIEDATARNAVLSDQHRRSKANLGNALAGANADVTADLAEIRGWLMSAFAPPGSMTLGNFAT